MLVAETKSNERLDLRNLTRDEINRNRIKKWYCPCCKGEVQIKNGSIKRPHFSHKSRLACDAFSENESEEHLLGKELIANNCEKFGITYELEAYLPKLKQRPDILIIKKIAIEFQCSAISLDRFRERTLTYQENGYEVIWVVGKQFQLKKNSRRIQKKFFYYAKSIGFYYLELDVFKEELAVKYFIQRLHSVYHFKERQWSLKRSNVMIIKKRMQENNYKDCWVIHQPAYSSEQSKNWHHRLNQKESRALVLQEFFYINGYNLRQLPTSILYPSFLTPILEEEEWKIRLLVEAFFYEKRVGTFNELYRYVNEKNESEMFAYVLINKKDLLVYSLSLNLCFLKKIKKITQQDNQYYLNDDAKSCPAIKAEILWLPLKYVMINE